MKQLKSYLEDLMATPMNTLGMGGITSPVQTSPGSGDIPKSMCIDIKTGKMYHRRKKFRRYKIA